MHAADLMAVARTGNARDVLDALQTMKAQHGEFLTALMMHSVLDHLEAERFMQLDDWDTDCEPMRWTPDNAPQGA